MIVKTTYIRRLIISFLTILMFFTFRLNAQDSYLLKGNVSSFSGKLLNDISISIEGDQSDPVFTDSLGNFIIEVPDGKVWMLVTPVSIFKPKRVFLNDKKILNVKLIPIGFSSQYDPVNLLYRQDIKRNITGSVYSYNQTDNISTNLTLGQDFQGRVPGMLSVSNSGMKGSGNFTNIRGLNGLFTNQQPLYIIDGIIYENFGTVNSFIEGFSYHPLSGIDPNDIVSVTVMKDITFLASLGSKAGNGVIVIETLKPTETRTTIDVSAYSGFNKKPQTFPVLNSSNYRTYAQDLLQTSGQPEEEFTDRYPGLYDDPASESYYRYNHETFWQDEIYRTSLLSGIYMNVRGGDEIGKYGLSVGYSNAQGIIKSTDLDRFSIRFVGSLNVFDWLKMFVSTNLNYTRSNLLETGVDKSTSPIFSSVFKPPFMSPYQYDEKGLKLLYLDDVDVFNVSNPVAIINSMEAQNNAYRFVGSFRFQGDIMESLKWNTIIGLNFLTMKESVFQPDLGMSSFLNNEANNLSRHKSDYLFSMQLDNNIGYEKLFSGTQKFKAYAGFRLMTNHLESDIGISGNTPSDEYTSLRYGSSGLRFVEGDIGNWNWLLYYANAEYSLLDRYFAGFSLALDGSSRVGKTADLPVNMFDRPFSFFPSFNMAWRLSEEYFLKNFDWLEEFKLRFSYGATGNDDIGNYNSRAYYEQVLYREITGLVLGFIPNTGLMNENYTKLNTGIDLSLWGERLNLSIDIYKTKTKDLFVMHQQEGFSGYEFQPVNSGILTNKGLDLYLIGQIIDNQNFKWKAGFNITFNKNNVESIQDDELLTDIEGGQIITRSGYPVNSFYGLVDDGIYTSTIQAKEDSLFNSVGIPFGAGDVKFKDLSGPENLPDGVINEYDKVPIGNPNPDFFGGIMSNFSYKKWSLDLVFQFNYGNDIFNYVRYQMEKMSNLENQSTSILRRWQYEGHETDIPRAYWKDLHGNNAFSTRWIEDGSYIKLKNITLSYTIPDKFLSFQNAKFYISASNVFKLTKYLGYDPEFSYSPKPYLQGVDYGIYPNTGSVIIGVKFGL